MIKDNLPPPENFEDRILGSKLNPVFLKLIYQDLISEKFREGSHFQVIIESLPKERTNMSYVAVWQEAETKNLVTIDFAPLGTHNASIVRTKGVNGFIDDSNETTTNFKVYEDFSKLNDLIEGAPLELRRRLRAVDYNLNMSEHERVTPLHYNGE